MWKLIFGIEREFQPDYITNRIGTAERDLLLRFLGRSELDRRGTLYVVATGVDDYTNSRAKSLRFAGADARAFCEAMLRHAGPLP